MKTVNRCYPFPQYFHAIIGNKGGCPLLEKRKHCCRSTNLMYQFTYTVSFGIVASEIIFLNYSLVNEDTYVYILFLRAQGGSISAPVIKERKEQNQQGRCTSTCTSTTSTFLFAIAKRRPSSPGIDTTIMLV